MVVSGSKTAGIATLIEGHLSEVHPVGVRKGGKVNWLALDLVSNHTLTKKSQEVMVGLRVASGLPLWSLSKITCIFLIPALDN